MRSCALLLVILGQRVLQKLKMDAKYEGNVEVTREDYSTKSTDIKGRSSLRLIILL